MRTSSVVQNHLTLEMILPPQSVFDQLYDGCDVGYVEGPMTLLDSAYRQPGYAASHPTRRPYDLYGYSAYGRLATALARAHNADRHFVRRNVWGLRHLSLLGMMARDYVEIARTGNVVFSSTTTEVEAKSIVEEVAPVIAYASVQFMNDLAPEWHANVCNSLRAVRDKSSGRGIPMGDKIGSPVTTFVENLYAASVQTETTGVRDARVLNDVLYSLLRAEDVTVADAEHWLQLAESIRQTGNAGIPHLDRYIYSLKPQLPYSSASNVSRGNSRYWAAGH